MKCKNFEKRTAKTPRYLDDGLKLWRDVAVATATTESAKDSATASRWANQVFKDYCELLKRLDGQGIL